MIRIWARTMLEGKITRETIFTQDGNADYDKLHDYLMDICYTLDIPTPLVLKPHKDNFYRYNIARFREVDFVESIDFDMLILENALE